jgi:hypothetical protein
MTRPVHTPRIDWVKAITWFGVIPLFTAGFWGLVFFGGRWVLKALGA